MSFLKLKLFGPLQLENSSGENIAVPGAKQQALLAILALAGGEPVPRDRIIGLLWGDRFHDQARQSLRQGISKLRQLLKHDGQEGLLTANERVALNMSIVNVDVETFKTCARKNTLEGDVDAAQTFSDTLLDGLFVREVAFEEWLSAERAIVNQTAFPIFERFADGLLKNGDQNKAIQIAQRLVALDTLRESSHRTLMRLYAQSSQRSLAISQYKKCEDLLRVELDVEPEKATKAVLEEVRSTSPAPYANDGPTPAENSPIEVSEDKSTKVRLTIPGFQCVGMSEDLLGFSVGLSEDLTTNLTRYRWLDVVSMGSIHRANGAISEERKTAKEQGIEYSVEGSIRQLVGTVRVTIQLVDLGTGVYVGVHRYDENLDGLSMVLDRISESAAATIQSDIAGHEGEKARKIKGDALGAWDCYHLGLSTQYEFSPEGNARAQALFRRAIDLDPSFSAAYARLSYAMVLSAIYFDVDPSKELLDEALELARTATRLDDQDAVARFAIGRAHLARGEYSKSVMELEQAISMNSSLAQAHCGLGDSLAYMGRSDEAIPHFEQAVRLSPNDPHRWAFSTYAAMASIFSGEYEHAADWAVRAVRVPNAHFWARSALISALGQLGRIDEASEALRDLQRVKPDFTCAYVRGRLFYLTDDEQRERYVDGLKKSGVPE